MTALLRSFTLLSLFLWASTAAAYNGPGSGVSFFAALWSVLAGFVVVISAIVFWPIRALLRRRKAAKPDSTDASS